MRLTGDSSPATKLEGHPGGIQGPNVSGSTVHRVGTMDGTKYGFAKQPRQVFIHVQDFRDPPGINTGTAISKPREGRETFSEDGIPLLLQSWRAVDTSTSPGLVTWNLSRPLNETKPDSCDFQNSGQPPRSCVRVYQTQREAGLGCALVWLVWGPRK